MNRFERETQGSHFSRATVVETHVRCEGHLHRLVATADGSLLLPDHSPESIRACLAAGALGGRCRCLEVFAAWCCARGGTEDEPRRGALAGVPLPLRDACARHRARGARRRRLAYIADVPVWTRLWMFTQARDTATADPATAALQSAQYKLPNSRKWLIPPWSGGVRICAIPSIDLYRKRHFCYVKAAVRRDWLEKVSGHGLAVVDGCFVLDVIEDKEVLPGLSDPLVLAGRQNPRGLEIRASLARVEDGKLRWLAPWKNGDDEIVARGRGGRACGPEPFPTPGSDHEAPAIEEA